MIVEPPSKSRNPELAARFERVRRYRLWGDGLSLSGPGSERGSEPVEQALALLDQIVRDYDVRSIADVPCGDVGWINAFLERHRIRYTGYDIVRRLVWRNRLRFPRRRFRVLDVTSRPPKPADLLFCKDLVNHLETADIWRVLNNIARSGARLVVISSNTGHAYEELASQTGGESRHVDLLAPPFSLPDPIVGEDYLIVWRGDDLRKKMASVATPDISRK